VVIQEQIITNIEILDLEEPSKTQRIDESPNYKEITPIIATTPVNPS
jgi:hypothetical protein